MSRPDPSIGFLFPLSPRAPDEKISPSDWLSQFTLCLAPIVVHIFIGVPVAVYLHRKEPRWHDMIGFYNPTTIIWRYMAIAERRARAKQWKAIDMAATNARFWDGEKWDGSQSMMEKSRPLCTRIPLHNHINFMSKTFIESVIITAQGFQAIYDLAKGTQGGWQVSIATIFYPLTIFGLLRLPAAYWLSEEGCYSHVTSEETGRESLVDGSIALKEEKQYLSSSQIFQISGSPADSMLHSNQTSHFEARPSNNWRGRAIRTLFLFCNFLIACVATRFIAPWTPSVLTITAFFQIAQIFYLATSTFLIIGFYCRKHQQTTVVIPCIQSAWYKVQTVSVFVIWIILFALACVETKKTACGGFNTIPTIYDQSCAKTGTYLTTLKAIDQSGHKYGSQFEAEQSSLPLVNKSFSGYYVGSSTGNGTAIQFMPFDGWCRGRTHGHVQLNLHDGQISNGTEWMSQLTAIPNSTLNSTVATAKEQWVRTEVERI